LNVTRKARRKNVTGARVAQARKLRRPRLTQNELSGKLARLGIQLDRAAIAKIENGQRYVLDYELKALARALGVDVSWLLGDEKN
jgi:HTH-type transcriptional regulator, cell division transcriptional repressor